MQYILGAVSALALITVVFFTSVEAPVFNKAFFRYEYKKNNVAENIGIDEQELYIVTEHIMDYLRDDRKDLVVYTDINGVYREFFNEREKHHMADVKNLFLAAYKIRRCAVIAFVLAFVLLFLAKADVKKIFFKSVSVISALMCILTVCLSVLISTDFNKYFTIFHEIFFDNNLWLLNPDTDLLINIVPLPFFIDISICIGILFILVMSVIIVSLNMFKKVSFTKGIKRCGFY